MFIKSDARNMTNKYLFISTSLKCQLNLSVFILINLTLLNAHVFYALMVYEVGKKDSQPWDT